MLDIEINRFLQATVTLEKHQQKLWCSSLITFKDNRPIFPSWLKITKDEKSHPYRPELVQENVKFYIHDQQFANLKEWKEILSEEIKNLILKNEQFRGNKSFITDNVGFLISGLIKNENLKKQLTFETQIDIIQNSYKWNKVIKIYKINEGGILEWENYNFAEIVIQDIQDDNEENLTLEEIEKHFLKEIEKHFTRLI